MTLQLSYKTHQAITLVLCVSECVLLSTRSFVRLPVNKHVSAVESSVVYKVNGFVKELFDILRCVIARLEQLERYILNDSHT